MSSSTIYDIRLRYLLEDKATKGLASMDRSMRRTAKSSGFLAKGFGRMAAAAGAAFGVRAAAKSLIGFNASMEQSKIQIQGMLTLGGKMDSAMANSKATKLFKDLQMHAKASVGTTKDMVDMASLITRPVMAAGLGMKDLGDFTAQAVVASKAFGIESGMAARDIESAMMGQLRSVDRFSRNLLEPLGYVGEEGRKVFNELGASARAAKLKEALASPAIAEMAKQQANSFDGVLSTFQDGMQMALGAVGKPLFMELTAEIKSWSEWMDKNKASLAEMGKSMGRGLVKGFKVVKGVIGFMVNHSDLLITVAKAWAAVKLGQGISGMAGGLGNMLGAGGAGGGKMLRKLGFDKAGQGVARFGTKLALVGSTLGSLALGVGLTILAVEKFADYMNRAREADLRRKREEKAEAIRKTEAIGIGAFGRSTGVSGASTGAKYDMDMLGYGQQERAAAIKAAKAAGVKGADAESFGQMSTEDIATSQVIVDGLADRQAFYQEAAKLAVGIGAIDEAGTVKGNISEDMYDAGQRFFGVGEGADGLAGETAEIRVMEALRVVGDELASLPEIERQLAIQNMITKQYVEGPTARAQEELAARNQPKGAAGKAKVNVTIQRIEVQSDDPDRFVFQLSEITRKLVRSPSQAPSVQRLGGS